MAKKAKEGSPEQKLRALYDLQIIDSKIDGIRTVRGELPLEVEDLEDEIELGEEELEEIEELPPEEFEELPPETQLIEPQKVKQILEEAKTLAPDDFDALIEFLKS